VCLGSRRVELRNVGNRHLTLRRHRDVGGVCVRERRGEGVAGVAVVGGRRIAGGRRIEGRIRSGVGQYDIRDRKTIIVTNEAGDAMMPG